jgi:hypothetical protein
VKSGATAGCSSFGTGRGRSVRRPAVSIVTVKADPDYADAVDLDRYPIHALGGAVGRALVAACRSDLRDHGVSSLPAFLTPDAIAGMVSLAARLAPLAWASDQAHTVYFEPVNKGVDARHPAARQVRSAKHGLAYDHIPPTAPLRRLYETDDLTRFIAAVLGRERLHRSADPLDALQITTFDDGEELGWHFDRSEFSVTVMYQTSAEGGHFEYCPGLRSDEEPNHAAVARVLDGDQSNVVRLPTGPGTLALFHGRYALHRVTPVGGDVTRINSVLTYGERPDMRLNDLTSRLFYGRTSA